MVETQAMYDQFLTMNNKISNKFSNNDSNKKSWISESEMNNKRNECTLAHNNLFTEFDSLLIYNKQMNQINYNLNNIANAVNNFVSIEMSNHSGMVLFVLQLVRLNNYHCWVGSALCILH